MKVACLNLLIPETSSLIKRLTGKKYFIYFDNTKILRLNVFKYKIHSIFFINIHYIRRCSSTITPSTSVRHLLVIFNDQLTFKEHIAKTARSWRFALHNVRKIRPFLTEHAAQLLVQALVISRLDYSIAIALQCSSNWTSIKHNQTFTDDLECSGTTGLQQAQKSTCHTFLYLPALAPGCSSHQVQDTDDCI